MLLCSRVRVGGHEPGAAAIFLAGEQRRDQPAGAGHPAAQTRQLPPYSLLAHDPLLVLRPQREAHFHRARGQDQVLITNDKTMAKGGHGRLSNKAQAEVISPAASRSDQRSNLYSELAFFFFIYFYL